MSFYSNSNVQARPIGIDMAAVMRQVYLWMTLGLGVSAFTAFFMASSGWAVYLYRQPLLVLITIGAYFILVLALQSVIMRSRPAIGTLFYLLITGLLGVTFSSIFLLYQINTIGYAFVATTATFGTMSIVGYTTKRDLSRVGSIVFMALVGLIIASIVNIFLSSSVLYWLINYAGVLIFVGLTAYDTQWLKNYASQIAASGNPDMVQRISLIGAFHLYLDFVNLFLFILNVIGGGRADRR